MRAQAKSILKRGAFIPAIPLALDSNRTFDERIQRRLVRYYLESGVDGIAVGVHTTQFAIRDPQINLFEKVLAVTIDEVRKYEARVGRVILTVAGVCGQTEQALNEADTLTRLGFDAALVSPSGLGALDETELLERMRAVAQRIDSIGFYLQSAVGGRVFSYDYWRALCDIPNVAAIKCAPFNRYQTLDVARAIAFSGRDITLYTGNDDNIVMDLLTEYEFRDGSETRKVRTHGGLLGHWAVWTHTAVSIFNEIKALDIKTPIDPKWLTLAAQITDANSAFFDARNNFLGSIAGIHEVLRRQGLLEGIWCLDPNEVLSKGQSAEIERVYNMYPHLNDDEFVESFLKSDESRM